MTSYIISFDTNTTPVSSAHSAIISTPGVMEWWHYLNGTYIVTSAQPLDVLTKNLKSRWPGGSLLIMKASKTSGGLLPKDAWDWINSRLTP